jgi:hypothetical protein
LASALEWGLPDMIAVHFHGNRRHCLELAAAGSGRFSLVCMAEHKVCSARAGISEPLWLIFLFLQRWISAFCEIKFPLRVVADRVPALDRHPKGAPNTQGVTPPHENGGCVMGPHWGRSPLSIACMFCCASCAIDVRVIQFALALVV